MINDVARTVYARIIHTIHVWACFIVASGPFYFHGLYPSMESGHTHDKAWG